MALSSKSEDMLERLAFDLGVTMAEAETGRASDAEFRSRMISLCKKWRGDVETLIATASDPSLHASVNLLSLRQENAALKEALAASKRENAELRERPEAPPPKKAQAEKKPEKPEEKSEFSDAMKDVKRY
jgi:hypothetical protein